MINNRILSDCACDLRWHWATREADSGLRSSHAALVAMIQGSAVGGAGGGGNGQDAAAARLDRKREVQARHARIEEALALIPAHRDVLYFVCGPHIVPRQVIDLLGDAAACAPFTASALHAHTRAKAHGEKRELWHWLITRKLRSALLVEVRAEAVGMFRAALTAYAQAAGIEPEKRAPRRDRAAERMREDAAWKGAA